jgi:hypothetical protein
MVIALERPANQATAVSGSFTVRMVETRRLAVVRAGDGSSLLRSANGEVADQTPISDRDLVAGYHAVTDPVDPADYAD